MMRNPLASLRATCTPRNAMGGWEVILDSKRGAASVQRNSSILKSAPWTPESDWQQMECHPSHRSHVSFRVSFWLEGSMNMSQTNPDALSISGRKSNISFDQPLPREQLGRINAVYDRLQASCADVLSCNVLQSFPWLA